MAHLHSGGLLKQGFRLLASAEGRALQRPALRCSSIAASCCNGALRPFSQSPMLSKKRKIAPASNSPSRHDSTSNASSPASSSQSTSSSSSQGAAQLDPENPLDLSSLTAAYAPIDVHFKAQIQAVVHGGRFNPESLGALPVPVKPTEDGAPPSFPLRELAQVVPRSGRTISLLVNDRAYIKPIMSAIQASKEFNQQPQRSEDNELELLLKVEIERRDELVRRVKEACQAWRDRIRQARTKHEKVLKDWKKSGAVLPDVIKKADKEVQKLQDKKMKEIDQDEAQTIKQLERNSS